LHVHAKIEELDQVEEQEVIDAILEKAIKIDFLLVNCNWLKIGELELPYFFAFLFIIGI